MIRKATQEDLTKIMSIVNRSVKIMNEKGSNQWDESYPKKSVFQNDLDIEELFVFEKNQEVVGVVCISETEHHEYPLISWSLSDKAITIKRLAVDPDYRGGEVADEIFENAETVAQGKGFFTSKQTPFPKTNQPNDYLNVMDTNLCKVERLTMKIKRTSSIILRKNFLMFIDSNVLESILLFMGIIDSCKLFW